MRALLGFVCLLLAAPAPAAEKRPMTVEDLLAFKRVSDPQISPDGRWVVYAVGTVNLDENKITSSLWLASTDGGRVRQLTNAPGKSDSQPRWSPDGSQILFTSNRSGTSQLWAISPDGGEAVQVTRLSTGASDGIWSPDGSHIAYVSAVYPEYSAKPFRESDALNKKRMEEEEKSPVKARVFTRLFFRHWDSYVEGKRQHLFVQQVAYRETDAPLAPGVKPPWEPRDVTPGDRDAHPTSSTFSAGNDFTFSPDGRYLLFTAVPAENEAWSTNYDICRVPIDNTSPEWETLTKGNEAADGHPKFSPSGKLLAYRAQKRAGFEADKWDLMVVECGPDGSFKGAPRPVTKDLDRSAEGFVWGPDNNTLFFTAEDQARTAIFTAYADDAEVEMLYREGTIGSLSIPRDGNTLAFARSSLTYPARVVVLPTLPEAAKSDAGVRPKSVIDPNSLLTDAIDWPNVESVSVPVEGAEMQMWVLKPPGFDPAKKWPLVYLVHGGPQGAWLDGWSYRWNPALWASQGYVVALPNPRGSTGFGQKFTDEISGDWGGKVYDDLMAGLAHLEKQPYIDTERMAAAGASYGGYMMNWFAVNTGKFKTLITHCGVWNFESMYATTEELWFDEWEHGGPPWGPNRHSYEKHSPHRLAANLAKFRTPMLIIHNDLDFRVPVSEGIQLFTTLQRLGVPSRMINFPDEGHWVLKPKNSAYWHREVFDWLKKHVPPGGK